VGLKTYLIGGLAAVAIAAGVGLYRSIVATAEARGRAAEVTAQLEAETAAFNVYKLAAEQRDSVRVAKLDSLRVIEDRLADNLALAQRRARRSVSDLDSLLAQSGVADSITRAVSETVTALEDENEACALAFENCRVRFAVQTERVVELTDGQVRRDSLIAAQRVAIDRLSAIGEPKTDLLPWAVAGAAVVIAGLAIAF
jgi:hypothetical protein